MKKNFNSIKRVEEYLQNKPGILTENTSDNEEFLDWDISITAVTKNNLVTTFTVKPNNTYQNDKVCIEFRKMVDEQFIPSGIGAAVSDFVILTFYDDPYFYMIRRTTLLKYAYAIKDKPVPKYTAMDKNKCQLALFDRPSLLKKCKII